MKKDFDISEDGDFESAPTFMLYDVERGCDKEYVLLARTVKDGQLYYALSAADDPDSYVILRVVEDGEDIVFETVDDDGLFSELCEMFDDLFSQELDYDAD